VGNTFPLRQETLQAFHEGQAVEVQEEGLPCRGDEFQVCDYLCGVNRCEVFNAFDFDDDPFVDEKIQTEATVYLDFFVFHWYWNLALYPDSTLQQFVSQTVLVQAFQQPWTKVPVNLDGGTDDCGGDRIPLDSCHATQRCKQAANLGGDTDPVVLGK
jgi:hypothetical protein